MSEEHAFLAAILEEPDNDTLKLVYADWLEERGDPRAEYLRLMMQVRLARSITPEQRQLRNALVAELKGIRTKRQVSEQDSEPYDDLERQLRTLLTQIKLPVPAKLQDLAATLDPNWLAIVSDPEIEGCGKVGWVIAFDFLCDKSWADLKPTGDDKVRHCETCQRNVYFCDNLVDARDHADSAHCIAVDLGIVRGNDDLGLGILGSPRPLDAVSHARLAAKNRA